MIKTLITWDLGATKCAAGIIEYHSATNQYLTLRRCAIKLTEAQSLDDLITQLEATLLFSMTDADAICIGAAGIYDGTHLILEKAYPYDMNFADIAQQRDWPPFAVIHDYAPVVCATFTQCLMDPAYTQHLTPCPINPLGRRVAIGVGTGLGIKDGVLLANGDFWLGQNEGGHIGICLAPETNAATRAQHHALMDFLARVDDTPVTFQKILSGSGTVRLQQFFYPDSPDLTPESIGMAIRAGLADKTLKAFAWYLGLFIGTIQLTFMPDGGIWIAGGVVMQHLALFDCPEFQQGIEASPAYLLQRQQFPLGILIHHDNALIGGAHYAVKRLL